MPVIAQHRQPAAGGGRWEVTVRVASAVRAARVAEVCARPRGAVRPDRSESTAIGRSADVGCRVLLAGQPTDRIRSNAVSRRSAQINAVTDGEPWFLALERGQHSQQTSRRADGQTGRRALCQVEVQMRYAPTVNVRGGDVRDLVQLLSDASNSYVKT